MFKMETLRSHSEKHEKDKNLLDKVISGKIALESPRRDQNLPFAVKGQIPISDKMIEDGARRRETINQLNKIYDLKSERREMGLDDVTRSLQQSKNNESLSPYKNTNIFTWSDRSDRKADSKNQDQSRQTGIKMQRRDIRKFQKNIEEELNK